MTNRDGEIVQHYTYKAFGSEQYYISTSEAFSVTNRYTGQQLDEDTGLYYYGSRYYDPEIGRFIQADSIVPGADSSQNFNRYSYCVNNPLKYIDPSGHSYYHPAMMSLINPVSFNVPTTIPVYPNNSNYCPAAIAPGAGSLTNAATGSTSNSNFYFSSFSAYGIISKEDLKSIAGRWIYELLYKELGLLPYDISRLEGINPAEYTQYRFWLAICANDAHAWIQYYHKMGDGTWDSFTVGLWSHGYGDETKGLWAGTDLRINDESYKDYASRIHPLSYEERHRFFEYIKKDHIYRYMYGIPINNCTDFARNCWFYVTNERLNHEDWRPLAEYGPRGLKWLPRMGVVAHPEILKGSILKEGYYLPPGRVEDAAYDPTNPF